MMCECNKCKGEILTEADPYVVLPKPSGTELICYKCYSMPSQEKLDRYKRALEFALDCMQSEYRSQLRFDTDKAKINQILGKEEVKK